MSKPHVARIVLYPIKSLDGVVVERAGVLANGALEHDRTFAIRDHEGLVVNGKRTPAVHTLRSTFDVKCRTVLFDAGPKGGPPRHFDLDAGRAEVERWLGTYFALAGPAQLVENSAGGWPDDTDAPGPTVVSTATLEAVAGWFPGISLDEVRRRFRANLEIGGVEPFWEDRLYREAGQVVTFEIGLTRFHGTNPCQRCVVPSRDTLTGDVTSIFTRTFAARRERSLPSWAARSRFDHYYRLAVNTRSAEIAGESVIRLGDEVRIIN
ncbi:MAG TPA: MOSC N-terminal beta barrel domain-containing protein [Pirellulales bacterium]|nr:MOSC N-terminal beta barrel domain-containing protein [Pirellulales bacterium]